MADAHCTARPLALLAGSALAACMQFSPFETSLSDDERDRTALNLTRLSQRPAPTPPWRFVVLADSHQAFDELSDVVDSIKALGDVELVVHAGDMTDLGLRQEYRWSLEELEGLSCPWLTVVGNHDALSNGKDIYVKMFGPGDYTFDHGGARFVLFNSNRLEYGAGVPDLDWLAQATAPQSGRLTIAITHQPSGGMGVPDYDQTLHDNGVLARISAHRHVVNAEVKHGLLVLDVGPAKGGRFSLFTFDGRDLSVESCLYSTCEPI